MTRKTLIEAAEKACIAQGFDFGTGFDYRLASQVERLPAAWLETPTLKKVEGRNEGVKHYALKINLLDRCANHSPSVKEQSWNALEQRASDILRSIGTHEAVRQLTDIEFAPAEFSLTTGGELSLSITCTAQMPF